MSEDIIGNLTIWLNPHKKSESEPDYRGKLDIEINGYSNLGDLSLWINRGINGIPIKLSGQITETEVT